MREIVNEILGRFNEIRKKRMKMTIIEKIIVFVFAFGTVATVITVWVDRGLGNKVSQQIAMWGMIITLISLFFMIAFAEHDKGPEFHLEDLQRINTILKDKEIKSKEERNLLEQVIRNSIDTATKKIHGMSIATGLLLSPVYFYIIDEILEAGWILNFKNGIWSFGKGMAVYIEIVMYALFVIGAINIIRIQKDRDSSIKKDLLKAIDEINLWLEIK